MNQIQGKVLVFTDLHLGLKQGSKSRLAICVNVIKEIIKYIKENKVDTCIFLGDWHHVRVSTENNVLNVSYTLMQALSKVCKVYCILGNHDLYMKNSTEINSLVIFKNIQNVILLDKPTEVSINGNKSLMVPWLGDTSKYESEYFDMMFGHFDVSTKYLVQTYIQEHSSKNYVSENTLNQLNNDQLLNSNSVISSPGDFVGDFIDVVKQTGSIFSGHIHGRKEFLAKQRKFIFVGSPYQQNLGEKDNTCGFYIINEDNSYEFHEIYGIPKHIDLYLSKVIDNLDTFDFKVVKNNIVHKIYDIEVDNVLDAKISQKINDMQPYEELLPDYEVSLSSNNDIKIQNSSIELIKKSKLDYIKTYISNIDKQVLDEQKIDSSKLYNIMSEYYDLVSDEK